MKPFQNAKFKKCLENIGIWVIYPLTVLGERLGNAVTVPTMRKRSVMAGILTLCLLLTMIPLSAISSFAVTLDHTHAETGLCDCGGLVINATNFPDAIFRSYVNTLTGADDGFLTAEELAAIIVIDFEKDNAYKDVESVQGLEFFTNLTELRCRNRKITALDVTGFPLLESLQCSGNQLTALDVSQNPKLEVLLCNENPLGTLDVTHNPQLTDLMCSDSYLSVLDVSQNGMLQDLNCAGNQLTTLDLSKNPLLVDLKCHFNDISALDLTKNPMLTGLNCQGNLLSSLDLTNNTELITLNCQDNRLTDLDLAQNTKLQELNCSSNALGTLDVTKNTAQTSLNCGYTQLQTLDVSQNTQLVKLHCYYNALQTLYLSNNLLLEELRCFNNQLKTLDLYHNAMLKDLNCNENQLQELDLRRNTALTSLECARNHLTSLNLTYNSHVESFSGAGQTHEITIDQKTMSFDMTTLPGDFHGENATVITAGNMLEGNTLTVIRGGSTVGYLYNTGLEDMNLSVTLIVTNPHAHATVDDGNCTTPVFCTCGREMVEGRPAHTSTGDNVATYYSRPICDVCGTEYGQKLIDSTDPTVEILFGSVVLNRPVNGISFDLFFSGPVTVTVASADDGMGLDKTYYYVADRILSAEELASVSWKEYTDELLLSPDSQNVIYAYAVDKAGNKSDLCGSVGIVLDKTAPVFSGITNGQITYGGAIFTVTEEYLLSVTLDGKPMTAQEGKYTIPADNGEHTVVATDKAGNTATCKLTVYKTYKVTFVADGKEIASVEVGHGKDATQPALPEKEGYTAKWDGNGKNITADTVITAVYEKQVVIPDTGDGVSLWLMTAVMLLSGLCLFGVELSKKRK